MADRKIDYDRGVIINAHKASGMDVFMYVDDPGNYLNAHGGKVSSELAAEAGYDIQKLEKERVRRERKLTASQLIDAELADDKDVSQEVVEERDGYKLVSTGLGRHYVLDPDGNKLTPVHMSLEVATKLLDGMAPKKVEVVEADDKGKKAAK